MTPQRSGVALRTYQLVAVLGVGWLLGRTPGMLAENRVEAQRLHAAFGTGGQDSPPAPASTDTSELVARVAAEVAAQVAERTVTQLVAAGWGPRTAEPQTIIFRDMAAPRGGNPEQVVRIVTETMATPPPAAAGWQLPPGAEASPAPTPASVPVATGSAAHDMATAGYAALAAGDRRRAASLLRAAHRTDPDAPQADAWAADLRRLEKRWAISAYTLARDGGTGDPLAASPILGGGQSGASVTWTPDPLAKRPLSLLGRVAAATGANGSAVSETAEAAVGVRWQPLTGMPVAVDIERRVALGDFARNAWAARLSGGAAAQTKLMGRSVTVEGWGEAGIVGLSSADVYGGLQGRAATPLLSLGKASLDIGAGVWAAGQRSYGQTITRLDAGPGIRFGLRPYPFTAQIDYRVRAAGNALPDSGPVLTVAGQF